MMDKSYKVDLVKSYLEEMDAHISQAQLCLDKALTSLSDPDRYVEGQLEAFSRVLDNLAGMGRVFSRSLPIKQGIRDKMEQATEKAGEKTIHGPIARGEER